MNQTPPPSSRTFLPADSHGREAWALLAATPGLSRRLHRVLEELRHPLDLLHLSEARWGSLGLSGAARRWLARPDRAAVAPVLAWLGAPDTSVERTLVPVTDDRYPPLLRQIADPPVVLLVHGQAMPSLVQPAVAMVGSRRASASAQALAQEMAGALASAGLCIVSGLASGIDAAAHRGALASGGGTTIAVLGTGPDRIYPAQNAALSKQIATYGCQITEFPPGTPARRHHFPQRNRIIAGMTCATVVVEAASESGSLITARLAAENGREVFAVPGSVRNPLTRGCHQLLRDGAGLVETPADVLAGLAEVLGASLPGGTPGYPPQPPAMMEAPQVSSPESAAVIDKLGHDPATIEELLQRTGLTAQALCAILPVLELQGVVHRQADGRYVLSPGQK